MPRGPEQACLCLLVAPADLAWSRTLLCLSRVLLTGYHTRGWLKAGQYLLCT